MTDNDFDLEEAFQGLNPDEAKALRAKIATAVSGAVQAHRSERQAAGLAQVQASYEAERNKIAQGGYPLERRIELLTDLKTRYRARGLQV